jgi:hypothetical protein
VSFCSHCGKPLLVVNLFCPNCGKAAGVKPFSWKPVVVRIAGLAIGVLIGIFSSAGVTAMMGLASSDFRSVDTETWVGWIVGVISGIGVCWTSRSGVALLRAICKACGAGFLIITVAGILYAISRGGTNYSDFGYASTAGNTLRLFAIFLVHIAAVAALTLFVIYRRRTRSGVALPNLRPWSLLARLLYFCGSGVLSVYLLLFPVGGWIIVPLLFYYGSGRGSVAEINRAGRSAESIAAVSEPGATTVSESGSVVQPPAPIPRRRSMVVVAGDHQLSSGAALWKVGKVLLMAVAGIWFLAGASTLWNSHRQRDAVAGRIMNVEVWKQDGEVYTNLRIVGIWKHDGDFYMDGAFRIRGLLDSLLPVNLCGDVKARLPLAGSSVLVTVKKPLLDTGRCLVLDQVSLQ